MTGRSVKIRRSISWHRARCFAGSGSGMALARLQVEIHPDLAQLLLHHQHQRQIVVALAGEIAEGKAGGEPGFLNCAFALSGS
jgi:hypothetical protein